MRPVHDMRRRLASLSFVVVVVVEYFCYLLKDDVERSDHVPIILCYGIIVVEDNLFQSFTK